MGRKKDTRTENVQMQAKKIRMRIKVNKHRHNTETRAVRKSRTTLKKAEHCSNRDWGIRIMSWQLELVMAKGTIKNEGLIMILLVVWVGRRGWAWDRGCP
jgi:hypothetical protein